MGTSTRCASQRPAAASTAARAARSTSHRNAALPGTRLSLPATRGDGGESPAAALPFWEMIAWMRAARQELPRKAEARGAAGRRGDEAAAGEGNGAAAGGGGGISGTSCRGGGAEVERGPDAGGIATEREVDEGAEKRHAGGVCMCLREEGRGEVQEPTGVIK